MMEAGRELDALVAEKVMGWRWVQVCGRMNRREHPDEQVWLIPGDEASKFLPIALRDSAPPEPRNRWRVDLPYYSTDIAAAWTVTERLHKTFTRVEIHLVENTACVLLAVGDEVSENYPVTAEATTMPLAICEAARVAAELGYELKTATHVSGKRAKPLSIR